MNWPGIWTWVWAAVIVFVLVVAVVVWGVYRFLHPRKGPPRIFISFVHEDEAVAKCVQKLLEAELEQDVFLSSDETHIKAGEDWLTRLSELLTTSDVVVLLLSRRAASRPWVNFEAGAAWILKKHIIPCYFGNQQVSDLSHRFAKHQVVDLFLNPFPLVKAVHDELNLKTTAPKPLKDRLFRSVTSPHFEELKAALREFKDD